ncbi:MAG: hypothetical protein ACI396_00615 [Acutalibacteraceae bacterium]
MKKIISTLSLMLIMAVAFAMNTFALAPVATGATKMPPWIIIVFVVAVVIVVLALLPKFRKK